MSAIDLALPYISRLASVSSRPKGSPVLRTRRGRMWSEHVGPTGVTTLAFDTEPGRTETKTFGSVALAADFIVETISQEEGSAA